MTETIDEIIERFCKENDCELKGIILLGTEDHVRLVKFADDKPTYIG